MAKDQAVAWWPDADGDLRIQTRGRALADHDAWLTRQLEVHPTNVITVLRVLRISGPVDWVKATLDHSHVAPGVSKQHKGTITEEIRLVETVGGSR